MKPRKLTKADLDKVRDIEGFPIGSDEDIIALSNAPYYTACPNPFIEEFIKEYGKPYDEETDDYHREPYAADVSEGKTDPIYMAHAYHTKVPYKAIMKYILHYTEPGDIVLDGFSGSGMTGIAAQMCGNINQTEQSIIRKQIKNVHFGTRNAILSDLAPIATFITDSFNHPLEFDEFSIDVDKILKKCHREFDWMFQTYHNEGNIRSLNFENKNPIGQINYTVWSDVLLCPSCGEELILWDVAVNQEKKKINDTFHCPSCNILLKKKDCQKSKQSFYDNELDKIINVSKQVPVEINYTYNGKRYDKKPDKNDLNTIKKINEYKINNWAPIERMCEGKESRRNDKSGITHTHHFFYKRNFIVMCYFINEIKKREEKIAITASMQRASKLYKYTTDHKFGTVTGTLYIPSLGVENSIFSLLERKSKDIQKAFSFIENKSNVTVQCSSTTDFENIPNNCIDYIFTDPPFGSNIDYSELSFLWDCWLKVKTNNSEEAIINSTQNKGLLEYQELMTKCFKEYYRVLKPNRWITIEFHNSKNAVWNAIQESIGRAGFIIADVRVLDKKQLAFKQIQNIGAVKQDLVISAYKPKNEFVESFNKGIGTVETVWNFISQHLSNVPIVVKINDRIEVLAERQAYLLFDRMIAYHIMQGMPIPIDASEFYQTLDKKYVKRDDMYFLPNQINEYDEARITTEVEDVEFSLFVTNEKSAISWLYQQLDEKQGGPKTYAELQPMFMQEVKSVDKYEAMPELQVMLEENFLQDEKGLWYIPDRTKAGDVAKLREKNLIKEFQGYMQSKGKLKNFRSEAIRLGFSKLWKEKNYKAIVEIAERLPEATLNEDDKLLMYYDVSLSRV